MVCLVNRESGDAMKLKSPNAPFGHRALPVGNLCLMAWIYELMYYIASKMKRVCTVYPYY